MKKSLSKNNGFTLVEIMMVLVIVSILSVAALPLLSGSSEEAAKLEGAQIESAINRARTLARTRVEGYQVVFDTAAGTITVSKSAGVVEVKAAEMASAGTKTSSYETTTLIQASLAAAALQLTLLKLEMEPETGFEILQAAKVVDTSKDTESLVWTLETGQITSVDFGGTNTLDIDSNGHVTVGGNLRVDYSKLYLTVNVEARTGCVSIVETRK